MYYRMHMRFHQKKRRNILNYLSALHLGLFETEYESDTPDLMKNFITKYEEDKTESSIAPFIIFKARYEIGCNKDISTAISLAKEAMDSPWRHNHIQNIVDILLTDKSNIPLVEEFLENLPRDASEIQILKVKADILSLKRDFSSALSLMEEAHKKRWDFGSYALAKVYANLLAREYHKAIRIADESLLKIKDFRERDVLIINREIAKKKLGLEVKKHELLSIIAHHQSKGDVAMCAFFLIGDELNANRQLQTCIERDYMNYFRFLEWPALPDNILARFSLTNTQVA